MARTMPCDVSPGDTLASAEAAAERLVASCLVDGRVGGVGLEVEAHCFVLADPGRRPGWDELTATIATLPRCPAAASSPSSPVELSSLPPAADAATAIAAMRSDRAALRAAFLQAGLGLVLLGADPLRPPGRVNPGGRYQAMERFFSTSGTGRPGPR